MIDELYQDKTNRDKRAKELQAQGYKVKRYHTGTQLIHPQYITDYHRKLTSEECGYGNTIYKTYFDNLYGVRIVYPEGRHG